MSQTNTPVKQEKPKVDKEKLDKSIKDKQRIVKTDQTVRK